MSKGLRLSEKWFRFGLWLVAIVFASFLIGLGSTVVENLPKIERYYTEQDFMDPAATGQIRAAMKAAAQAQRDARENLEQTQLKYDAAKATSASARESFDNWIATRHATQSPDQDKELIARTSQLDQIKAAERKALQDVEAQRQKLLDAEQAQARQNRELDNLRATASVELERVQRSQELHVFLYRLALTLPLLAIAGWLFAKKRKSTYWPFVWGFIYFALFAFFVELVPYLPSYGGYVRYAVGIIVTVLVGRQAIVSLNRYLEKQKQAEALPDAERRKELSYDTALARLGRKVCPGCERQVDLDNPSIDYCPHCGICLFNRCTGCNARKNAFSRFCFSCGKPGAGEGQAAQ